MDEVVAKDFSGFIRHTDAFDLIWEFTVFRGQSIRGNLIPGVARTKPEQDTTGKEKQHLAQLRLLGASLLPHRDAVDLDLLVLAQHFGLKTLLLDWTSNPLAALWFACFEPSSSDAYVYALAADGFLAEDIYDKDPFTTPETRVFQPRFDNPRVIAQHGWFTLHRYSKHSGRFVPLEENSNTKSRLTEIRIPAASKAQVLSSLDRHGVNGRTLFPDLQGLCSYINWRYPAA